MFDKLDHSGNHSRKYTGNSNMFMNEEGTHSDSEGKDIFAMNIAINYVKD